MLALVCTLICAALIEGRSLTDPLLDLLEIESQSNGTGGSGSKSSSKTTASCHTTAAWKTFMNNCLTTAADGTSLGLYGTCPDALCPLLTTETACNTNPSCHWGETTLYPCPTGQGCSCHSTADAKCGSNKCLSPAENGDTFGIYGTCPDAGCAWHSAMEACTSDRNCEWGSSTIFPPTDSAGQLMPLGVECEAGGFFGMHKNNATAQTSCAAHTCKADCIADLYCTYKGAGACTADLPLTTIPNYADLIAIPEFAPFSGINLTCSCDPDQQEFEINSLWFSYHAGSSVKTATNCHARPEWDTFPNVVTTCPTYNGGPILHCFANPFCIDDSLVEMWAWSATLVQNVKNCALAKCATCSSEEAAAQTDLLQLSSLLAGSEKADEKVGWDCG